MDKGCKRGEPREEDGDRVGMLMCGLLNLLQLVQCQGGDQVAASATLNMHTHKRTHHTRSKRSRAQKAHAVHGTQTCPRH